MALTVIPTGQPISAWSFNRLLDFEKCPYKAFLKYSLKRPESDHIDKTALNRGKEVHTDAEDFIQLKRDDLPKTLERVKPLITAMRAVFEAKDPNRTIEIEGDWGYTRDWLPTGWMADDVWARIKLDVFERDMVSDTGIVTDWKTGKKWGNEVKHAQQAQVYVVGAFMRYPDLGNVVTQFVYTDQPGNPVTRHYTREQGMKMLPIIDRRAEAMTTATQFPPKANKINCKYCPFGPNKKYGDASCEYGVDS